MKQQADAIQKFLKNEGVTLPRGKVRDMVARFCGDKEWNSLNARLKATAPGTEVPKYISELQDLLSTLGTAKSALDGASPFVDCEDDEEYTYQHEIEAVEASVTKLEAIISGERRAKSEGVTIFVFKSKNPCDEAWHLLLPATVDPAVLASRLAAWSEAKSKALAEARALDDPEALRRATADCSKQNFEAEAIRWGAFCPSGTVRFTALQND